MNHAAWSRIMNHPGDRRDVKLGNAAVIKGKTSPSFKAVRFSLCSKGREGVVRGFCGRKLHEISGFYRILIRF